MTDQGILNKIAKGAGIGAIGIFASKFFSYLYRAIVARWVGPEAYGELMLGVTAVNLVGTFIILGLGTGLKNYIPKYREKNDWSSIVGAIRTAMRISLPLSILSSIIVFLSAEFLATQVFGSQSQSLVTVIRVLSLMPFFANLADICISTSIGFQKIKHKVYTTQIFQNVIQLTATAVLIIGLGLGSVGASIGWILGEILAALLAFYLMKKLLKGRNPEPNYQYRKLVKYSAPLFLSGTLTTIISNADTFLLGFLQKSVENVGIYNAALPTATLVSLPTLAIGSLMLPSMSELVEKGENITENLKTVTYWTFSMTFPAFVIIFLFAEEVLNILFGPEYIAASTALIILSLGNLFSSAIGQLGSVMKALDKTGIIFRNNVGNVVLNVGLNFLLIPRYGMVGAALATTLSGVFIASLFVAETYYTRGIHGISKRMVIPVVSALIPLGLLYVLLDSAFNIVPIPILIAGGAAFGLLYAAIYAALGGFGEEEKKIIEAAGEKYDLREEAEKLVDLVEKVEMF